MIDLGDRIGGFEEGVVVVDSVHDGDEIAESSDETSCDLEEKSDRDIALRIWNFLSQMCNCVDWSNTECSIEHAGNKDEAIRISNISNPVFPHKRRRRMRRSSTSTGHDCNNDDSDDETSQNDKHSKLVQVGHGTVGQADASAGDPRGDDICDKDVPRLGDEIGMVEGVHLDEGV